MPPKKKTTDVNLNGKLKPVKQQNPCRVYDFTLAFKIGMTEFEIANKLKTNCSKWAFQLEQSESGYVHYQGRFSLKEKCRMKTAKDLCELPTNVHLSITTKSQMDNDDYVTKDFTRIKGPWSNKAPPKPVPWDMVGIELRGWQIKFYEYLLKRERRIIDYIYDPEGNHGKSVFCDYCYLHHDWGTMPFFNDYKDIMRAAMGIGEKDVYFFDMPRAICKDKIRPLYAGIEHLKDGRVCDDRYGFRYERWNPPRIVIFSNQLPEKQAMSGDRWKVWTFEKVNGEDTLVPYVGVEDVQPEIELRSDDEPEIVHVPEGNGKKAKTLIKPTQEKKLKAITKRSTK